jgi:hypothetical protein
MDRESKTISFIGHETRHKKSETSREPEPEKIKRKRVITQTDKWTIKETDLETEQQIQCLDSLYSFYSLNKNINELKNFKGSNELKDKTPEYLLYKNIVQKLNGYKAQDCKKNKYNESEFIKMEHVLHLLFESRIQCYYCRKPVQVLYENVREPKQWTLERIDNSIGHNVGNIEIACLSCNLNRRTMYPERYIFTKQLVIKKII